MTQHTSDKTVLSHIGDLVDEEKKLYAKKVMTDQDRARLSKIGVELDQCWDLLRQRRGLREFGKNPDKAQVRSKETVEGYEQ